MNPEHGWVGRGLPAAVGQLRDEAAMRALLGWLGDAGVDKEEDGGADGGGAGEGGAKADLPIAAMVLGPEGEVLGVGRNHREASGDPTGHAEVEALRAAAAAWGDGWRLEGCTLVVTLEPCAMCAGAAVNARVGRIVFGAYEPRTGACGSWWDVPREAELHRPAVRGGVLREECEAVLREFFRERR